MPRWWPLAIRNWQARPGRSAGCLAAIALGAALVVWIACCFRSLDRSLTEWVLGWIGKSHLTVQSALGRWGTVPEDLARIVDADPDVADFTTRLWWAGYLSAVPPEAQTQPAPTEQQQTYRGPFVYEPPTPGSPWMPIDIVGVDPRREYRFRDLPARLPADQPRAILIEQSLADDLHIRPGQTVYFRTHKRYGRTETFRVAGIFPRNRISRFQPPLVQIPLTTAQQILGRPAQVTAIDVLLADGSPANIRAVAQRLRRALGRENTAVRISTAEARLRQLAAARRQMQLILSQVALIAFLASFFIIYSTLSMGLVERTRQMGLLRCVGMTRAQLAALVLIEALPLGIAGVAVGIPLGLALADLTVRLVPEYLAGWVPSRTGMLAAAIGGLGTTLLAAIIPAAQAAMLTPLAATRTDARARPHWPQIAAASAGALIIALQHYQMTTIHPEHPLLSYLVAAGTVLMVIGYALLAPLAARLAGQLLVRPAAAVLRLPAQLLYDQTARAPWRSAAICAALMIGLAMIVANVMHSEGIIQGWQFPRRMPGAFLYAPGGIDEPTLTRLRQLPHITNSIAVNAFPCQIGRPRGGIFRYLQPMQRFAAIELEHLPRVIELQYLEGSAETAIPLLRSGRGILISREFAETFNRHLGDRIAVSAGTVRASFEVAGVIASPAVDIAVAFFEAGGEFQIYSVGAVIGTREQARNIFNVTGCNLLLFDFAFPPTDPPTTEDAQWRRARGIDPHATLSPQQRLDRLQWYHRRLEKRTLDTMAAICAPKQVFTGSIRELKEMIDREMRRVTALLNAIPVVWFVIAAIGVGNLMMASVTARARQLALLRAVGATRSQVARTVLAEVLLLAAVGAALGLALGAHSAWHANTLVARLSGFHPRWIIPWDWIAASLALTAALCLLAALAPAARAARSNVMQALQTT